MSRDEICGNCVHFQKGERVNNDRGNRADMLRVSSSTQKLSRCQLTGQATKRTDPACTAFRSR